MITPSLTHITPKDDYILRSRYKQVFSRGDKKHSIIRNEAVYLFSHSLRERSSIPLLSTPNEVRPVGNRLFYYYRWSRWLSATEIIRTIIFVGVTPPYHLDKWWLYIVRAAEMLKLALTKLYLFSSIYSLFLINPDIFYLYREKLFLKKIVIFP